MWSVGYQRHVDDRGLTCKLLSLRRMRNSIIFDPGTRREGLGGPGGGAQQYGLHDLWLHQIVLHWPSHYVLYNLSMYV